MRESADGNCVDSLRGIVLDIFFGNAAARFEQNIFVKILGAKLLNDAPDLLGRKIIEEQKARICAVGLLTKATELGRRCDSGSCAADLNFDKSGMAAHGPSAGDNFEYCILFARREKRQMVVLDENCVAKAKAMSPGATQMRRALIEQAPRRFARSDDAGLRITARDPLLQPVSGGSYTAHALQKIQDDALDREQMRFVTF